jgi:outer membrane protein OmpA-like peptidoglycan-associated protein
VKTFFDKEVKLGNEDLGIFIALLEKALIQENQKVEIVLQGFASPRASAAYNDALSKRRVSSVMNQITKYSDGKLMPFMQNKKLVISEKAYGSRRAPKYVSGSLKDVRNSIYSIPASRERRVEIIKVTREKSNRR